MENKRIQKVDADKSENERNASKSQNNQEDEKIQQIEAKCKELQEISTLFYDLNFLNLD